MWASLVWFQLSRTSLGQMKFGPEIGYQYQTAGGMLIEPRLMIEGIWNFARERRLAVRR